MASQASYREAMHMIDAMLSGAGADAVAPPVLQRHYNALRLGFERYHYLKWFRDFSSPVRFAVAHSGASAPPPTGWPAAEDRPFELTNHHELTNFRTYKSYVERETLPEGLVDSMLLSDAKHTCAASGLCFPGEQGGFASIDLACRGFRIKCPHCHRERAHKSQTCAIGDEAAHCAKKTGDGDERPRGYDPHADFSSMTADSDPFTAYISKEESALRDLGAARGAHDDDGSSSIFSSMPTMCSGSIDSSDDEDEGQDLSPWYDGDIPRDVDDIPCDVCGDTSSPDNNQILLCDGDGCDHGRHVRCCASERQTIDWEADWFCGNCPTDAEVAGETSAASAPAKVKSKPPNAAAASAPPPATTARNAAGPPKRKEAPDGFPVGTILAQETRRNHRTKKMEPHVHIHWAGCSPQDDTWEPLTNLSTNLRLVWQHRRVEGRPLYVHDEHPSSGGTRFRPTANLFDKELAHLLSVDPDALGVACTTEKENIKAGDGTFIKPSDKKTYGTFIMANFCGVISLFREMFRSEGKSQVIMALATYILWSSVNMQLVSSIILYDDSCHLLLRTLR